MQISEKLINKFLTGQCSPEEKAFVTAWFRDHPDQLEYFLTEQSWDKFSVEATRVPASERMLEQIDSRINKKQHTLLLTRWMAAASILILITVSLFVFTGSDKKAPLVARKTVLSTADTIIPVLSKNYTRSTQKITLPDGSIVTLSPGSSIRYAKVFINHRRDIYLSGEARFKVAKDASSPFCVHSGNINTTALGTVFTVSEHGTHQVLVKLFEGKVVVRSERKTSHMKDVYLTPGLELAFNNESGEAAVHPIKTTEPKHKKEAPENTSEKIPALLNFSNQPLEKVFASLEEIYHVKINYETSVIKDMSFTGDHKTAKETLDDLLNTIATLNDLIIKKEGTNYTVSQAN